MKYRVLALCAMLVGVLHAQDQAKQPLNLGIGPDNHTQMAQLMNNLLANEYLLAIKTQNFHWNVTGQHFVGLHKLFGDQYAMLQTFIDTIAERTRALGAHAIGTLAEFIDNGTIKETKETHLSEHEMLEMLLNDQQEIIRQIRAYIDLSTRHNDMGSNNLLSDLLEKHEKMVWMMRVMVYPD